MMTSISLGCKVRYAVFSCRAIAAQRTDAMRHKPSLVDRHRNRNAGLRLLNEKRLCGTLPSAATGRAISSTAHNTPFLLESAYRTTLHA
jgi:hypothetical protein